MFVFSKYQQVVYEAKLSDSRPLGGGRIDLAAGAGEIAQCKKLCQCRDFVVGVGGGNVPLGYPV